MKLTKNEQSKILDWLYGSGRDLDVARLNYLFGTTDNKFILDCLSIYQNKDGGFGNSLNNDTMNPYSTCVATAHAIKYIIEAGYDKNSTDSLYLDIMKKLSKYLCTFKGNYYPLTDKKNNKFPSANYLKDGSPESKYYPTCIILAGIYKLLPTNNVNYILGMKKIDIILQEYLKDELNELELSAISYLLNILKEDKDISIYLEKFEKDLNNVVGIKKAIICDGLIQIEQEVLDELINSRLKVGVWDVRYNWGNSAPEQEICEIKEISKYTTDNVLLLNKYNSLE